MVLTKSAALMRGVKAPEFSLPGLDGHQVSLDHFAGRPVLIVFMCNHCPYVKPKVDELVRIQKSFPKVEVIGINSNDVEQYPEDAPEQMEVFAKEHHLNFPYLFDESQEVAHKFGAVCTPDPFLFDADHKLVWQGRISSGGQELGEPELYGAIEEFLKTGKITRDEVRSMGCSIKWK